MPVRIKICGVTGARDAVAAAEAGADALGFMFFEGSKRYVTPMAAAGIIRELPPFIARVGVFVNAAPAVVRAVIDATGIDTLQFHGEETPEYCAQFGVRTIKAFRIRNRETLADCLRFQGPAWLLDSHVEGALGGTGVSFDWEVAAEATKLSTMVLLAGGLKVETVAEAVRRVRPYAVDVSSGVESAPGKKDHDQVRAFIAAARAA